jgi:hypothetical protein
VHITHPSTANGKQKTQSLYIKKNRAKEQNWQRREREKKDEKKTRENDS